MNYIVGRSTLTLSFQIGAASSARSASIPDSQIQVLGRWKSDAYKSYIRTPLSDLADLSKVLAAGPRWLIFCTY